MARSRRCSGCVISTAPQIESSGPEDSPVVIVGECPGAQEVKQGKPFVGSAGKLLRGKMMDAGLSFSHCRVTNSFMCQKQSSMSPLVLCECSDACRDRLRHEIQSHPRVLILAFGKIAAYTVAGIEYKTPIDEYHGQIVESRFVNPDGKPIPVLLAVHPAAILHGGGEDGKFGQFLTYDLGNAVRFLKSGQPLEDYRQSADFKVLPDSLLSLRRVLRDAGKSGSLGLDLETTGLDELEPGARILGFAVCGNSRRATFFTGAPRVFAREFKKFKAEFPACDVVGHNSKFDAKWIAQFTDIHPSDIFTYDTLHANGLIANTVVTVSKSGNVRERVRGQLKHLVKSELGFNPWNDEALEARDSGNLGDLSPEMLAEYGATDAWATRELYLLQYPRLQGERLEQTMRKVVMPQSNLFAAVESRPLFVDKPFVLELGVEIASRLSVLLEELEDITEVQNFNPWSAPQVSKYLFEDLGLEPLSYSAKTKNPSTDKSTLAAYCGTQEAVRKILWYRRLQKVYGTYVKKFVPMLSKDRKTGLWFLRPSYNIGGAITGRLSSSDPNIMQLPKRIRGIFIPPPGHVFVSADLRQAEARVMAMYCLDPKLLEVFNSRTCPGCSARYEHSQTICPDCLCSTEPTDPYRVSASIMYGEDRADEMRDVAKVTYLAGIYGESPWHLAERTGVPVTTAKKWLGDFSRAYPGQTAWMKRQHRIAETPPHVVRSLFGRVRRLHEYFNCAGSQKYIEKMRRDGLKASVNSPVQGACVSGETLVLTGSGYAPIGSLEEGSLIRAWTGQKWADAVVLRKPPRDILRVVLSDGRVLRCDPTHKFFEKTDSGYAKKCAGALSAGDLVATVMPSLVDLPNAVTHCGFSYTPPRRIRSGCDPRCGRPLVAQNHTPELFYLLGSYVANGSISNGGTMVICFGDRKNGLSRDQQTERLCEVVRSLGLVPNVSIPRKNQTRVAVSSVGLVQLFNELGVAPGATAHTKRVPRAVWGTSTACRAAFLSGVVLGDGGIADPSVGGVSLHLCNEMLVRDMQLLCDTLGIVSSVRGPYACGRFVSWRLDMNAVQFSGVSGVGSTSRKLVTPGHTVPAGMARTWAILRPVVASASHRTLLSRIRRGGSVGVYTFREMLRESGYDPTHLDLFCTASVVSVEPDGSEPVYTLSVGDPSHRYIANGVVSGNSSDMCALAMARIDRLLEPLNGWTQIFVHDEVAAVCPNKDSTIRAVKKVMREELTRSPVPQVTLEVEFSVYERWAATPEDAMNWVQNGDAEPGWWLEK